jgi:hypothetical protein
MKTYIDLNTELRRNAKNNFETDLFKLFSNSVYGKSIENVRKHFNLKFLQSEVQIEKAVAKSTFKDRTILCEDPLLVSVSYHQSVVLFNKPLIVGASVLSRAKVTMSEQHHDVMLPFYSQPGQLNLLYMDTDSLIYEVFTEDIYRDLLQGSMQSHFDTSNYPQDHPAYSEVNKRKVNKFKDEAGGKIVSEFVGLRSKMYMLTIEGGKQIKRAKGVSKSVVSKQLSIEDYLRCLYEHVPLFLEMRGIRSYKHQVYSILQNKLSKFFRH